MKFFKEQTIHQVALMGRNAMLRFWWTCAQNALTCVDATKVVVPAGFDKVYSMDEAEQIADENMT